MKFLIFNLAVAAALVFLFTADRSEVQRVAGQVHDAVGEVKSYARKALDDGKAAIAEPAVAVAPAPAAPPMPAPQAEVRPALTDTPKAAPQKRSAPPSPPPARTAVARAEPAANAIPPAPSGLDPAVAERRREVLDGIAAADPAQGTSPAPVPALKEGTRLMSASERRKELLSLAEEMELLYARSVGQ